MLLKHLVRLFSTSNPKPHIIAGYSFLWFAPDDCMFEKPGTNSEPQKGYPIDAEDGFVSYLPASQDQSAWER
jgi:hypothetical protein